MQEELCTTAISFKFFLVLSPKPANGTVQEVGKKRMGMVLDNVTKSQTKLETIFFLVWKQLDSFKILCILKL